MINIALVGKYLKHPLSISLVTVREIIIGWYGQTGHKKKGAALILTKSTRQE